MENIQQQIRRRLEETMPYVDMQSKLTYSEMEKIIHGFEALYYSLLEELKK